MESNARHLGWGVGMGGGLKSSLSYVTSHWKVDKMEKRKEGFGIKRQKCESERYILGLASKAN